MMTLRHLYIFKTVTETNNFTKAAEKLYITQSAVSHAIRELEEYAQTALFDRLSKRVQLTRSGELLLEEILPVLAACESLDKRIKGLEKQAPIHVVSSITIAIHWLPNILVGFRKQWPGVTVQVEVVSAANALETLKSKKRIWHSWKALFPRVLFSTPPLTNILFWQPVLPNIHVPTLLWTWIPSVPRSCFCGKKAAPSATCWTAHFSCQATRSALCG